MNKLLMTTPSLIKQFQSSIQPLATWIILASCVGLFFSRQLSLIGGIIGISLWLLSTVTKKQLHLLIPFITTIILAFTIHLPFANIKPPITVLGVTIMFWGLILTTTALCLHYISPKNQ